MLISIDGIDGCGKSTQVKRLSEALGAETIQEISDSRWGRTLRSLEAPTFEEQLAYFLADRAHLAPTLEDAAGSETRHIVSDRSYLSGVGYQSFNSGLSPERIENINRAIVPEYDLMIVLNIPVQQSLERVRKRGEKLTWCENDALLTWASRVFETWATMRDNIVLVNAAQTPDEVTTDLLKVVEQASQDKFGRLVWKS